MTLFLRTEERCRVTSDNHCPFMVVSGVVLRHMDGSGLNIGRFLTEGVLHFRRQQHVTMARSCPDHLNREVGWKSFSRDCCVEAQKLIDEHNLSRSVFVDSELEILDFAVCFPETSMPRRLVFMATRDGFVSEENLEPFAGENLDDPDFDSEELLNMVLSQIMAQDGDVDKIFARWRVGEVAD